MRFRPRPLCTVFPYTTLFRSRDKRELLPRLLVAIRPRGRFVLVEYDVDQGNPWVPYPVSFEAWRAMAGDLALQDRKSTRLNSSHRCTSYAVFCLKKKNLVTAV